MSKRPTPETDAALYPINQVDIVWPEFARKLERERNEARATIQDAKKALNATDVEGVLLASLRVKEERDDALSQIVQAECRAERFCQERDEARAVAYDLATIASHCLGWHDHETSESAERISGVLKKWKQIKSHDIT